MSDLEFEPPREICQLEHAMFSKLGDIMFRRSLTDGTPMMILPFGEREAGLPLRSLQHAFEISDDSPDGQMLGQIAESLDYVTCLRPGDPLPAEVVNGQASWEPSAAHRRTAATRLRLQLLAWLDPAAGKEAGTAQDIEARIEGDPAIRAKVQTAFREAATTLDLASSEEVVALVERVGEELAFIEALRERLLARVQALVARVGQIVRSSARVDHQRREDVTQVLRLGGMALGQFRARFEDVDAQTGEIIATLRNADSQIAYIRSNRDTLYRSLRAWEPVLEEWRKADAKGLELGPVIATTYQFLAQRYLPTSEWPSFNSLRQAGAPRKPEHTMVW
jgi:hypothetical protein